MNRSGWEAVTAHVLERRVGVELKQIVRVIGPKSGQENLARSKSERVLDGALTGRMGWGAFLRV